MSKIWIRFRDTLSRSLDPAEREAVLGDFAELALTDRQVVNSLLGLVMRRQLRVWKEWKPWFAVVAIILPVCPLLATLCTELGMGIWPGLITWLHHGPSYDTGLSPVAFWVAICFRATALVTWSWTSGFALGTLSRRTIWVSGVVFFGFYVVLANAGQPFSIKLCWLTGMVWLLLSIDFLCVLLPAYSGIHHSSKVLSIKFPRIVLLAIWTMTIGGLTLWAQGWNQAARDNWSRGGSALTLLQLAQHADPWKAGMTELLTMTVLTGPICYVIANDALFYKRRVD